MSSLSAPVFSVPVRRVWLPDRIYGKYLRFPDFDAVAPEAPSPVIVFVRAAFRRAGVPCAVDGHFDRSAACASASNSILRSPCADCGRMFAAGYGAGFSCGFGGYDSCL